MLIKYSIVIVLIISVLICINYLLSIKKKKYLLVIYTVLFKENNVSKRLYLQEIILQRLNYFNKNNYKSVIFFDNNKIIYYNDKVIPNLQYNTHIL